MTSYWSYKMATIAAQIYFWFLVWLRLILQKSKAISKPNFDQIFQSTAEVLLLPVSENKRPLYWNFTSGFGFDFFAVISMWFCTGLPNLSKWNDRRRSYDVIILFYKMTAIASQSTSGFRFGHVWHLGRPKAIAIPNFDQISQSTADILLFPVSRNKRPPSWNSTSGFDFDLFIAVSMWFSAAELWRQSDFQNGDHQPFWIWFRVMVAQPRSASGGLCFVLNFRLDRIYSFGDRAIFIFRHFGLKLHIHAHFKGAGGWRNISPNDFICCCNP